MLGHPAAITRVLVLEDDESDYAATRALLERAGPSKTYRIERVRTFDEGLAAVLSGARDPTTRASGGDEVILLVEDDSLVRELVRTVLTNSGYRVMEASDGGEALQLVEKHPGPIDLLVTDVIMPHMSGRELVERARKLRPSLRCLYTSGYTENAIAHHGVLDPGTPFIQKPFAIVDLANMVRDILDAPRRPAS